MDGDSFKGAEGRVKWFDEKRGYGFIVGPDGQDIFVHYSAITARGYKTLKEGDHVIYDAERGPRGWHAPRVDPGPPPEATGVHSGLEPEPAVDSAQAEPPKYNANDHEVPKNSGC